MARNRALIDQVVHPRALAAAFEAVRRSKGAPGVDGISLEAFGAQLEAEVAQLSKELRGGWYAPLPVRRVYIPKGKGGRRAIGIPAVRDRVVSRACQRVLGPRLGRIFCPGSYAYRPKRSCQGAVDKALGWLRAGHGFVALIDIEDFFPSINRQRLLGFLDAELRSDPIVPLVGVMMASGVVHQGSREASPLGIEQGHSLSPLLANLYLQPWDRALTDRRARWIRYSDNALIACRSRAQAEAELRRAREDLALLDLKLNATQSQVADGGRGFAFLGYHLSTAGLGPEAKSIEGLQAKLKAIADDDMGASLGRQLAARRAVLSGWHAYYGSFRGASLPDPVSFAAAMEVAAARGDKVSARWLLSAEVSGAPPDGVMAVVAEAASRLGLYGEGAPSGGNGTTERPRRPERRPPPQAARPGTGRDARRPTGGDEAPPSPPGPEPGWGALEARILGGDFSAPPRAAPPQPQATRPEVRVSRRALGLLVERFASDAPVHGRWRGRGEGDAYEVVEGSLDEAAWRRHLGGDEHLALCLSGAAGHWVGILDVDVERALWEGAGPHPTPRDALLASAHAFARRLMAGARARGLHPLLEDSGRRGRHVWLTFQAPADRGALFTLLSQIRDGAGPPPPGVTCEIFPGDSEAEAVPGGALMKLPLGVHPIGGGRSFLLEESGSIVTDAEAWLDAHPPDAPLCAGRALDGSLTPQVQAMLRGCPALAQLVDKARQVGHLTHKERQALMRALVPLGAEGERALHAIIGRCEDYDRRTTQGYVDKAPTEPLSCKRLREWLPDLFTSGGCRCPKEAPPGLYPSPLLHAVGLGGSAASGEGR